MYLSISDNIHHGDLHGHLRPQCSHLSYWQPMSSATRIFPIQSVKIKRLWQDIIVCSYFAFMKFIFLYQLISYNPISDANNVSIRFHQCPQMDVNSSWYTSFRHFYLLLLKILWVFFYSQRNANVILYFIFTYLFYNLLTLFFFCGEAQKNMNQPTVENECNQQYWRI